jgi:hypothetical protein
MLSMVQTLGVNLYLLSFFTSMPSGGKYPRCFTAGKYPPTQSKSGYFKEKKEITLPTGI